MKKIIWIFSVITILLSATALLGKNIMDTVMAKSTSDPGQDRALPIVNASANANVRDDKGYYQVYQNAVYLDGFGNYTDALNLAVNYEKSYIVSKYGTGWLWDNYPPFIVFTTNTEFKEFYTFPEATAYARDHARAFVYNRKDDTLIWSNVDPLPEEKKISGIMRIEQMPELPRGCEVTSLAMLMNYKKKNVTKLELAENIDKNPVKISRSGGKTYCGDPNDGFIGDMYDFSKHGLGVYHAPIAKLLAEYLPNSTVDLTGCEFGDLYYSLNLNRPVWVIINSSYAVLPASEFETWVTPSGKEIQITYREHSVLVTGYDANNVYFLDPLNQITSLNKNTFIKIWEQMGRQAVTVST